MRLNRLRSGELLALVGAVGLLVLMFTDWYSGPSGRSAAALHTTGWSAVGWFAAGITAITILLALLWLLATVTQESPALPVTGEVITSVTALLTVLALGVRLIFQPGLGIGLPNAAVDLEVQAYLGPLLALLLFAGAWRAMADERREAAYSQPGEIELRPLPE